MYSVTAIIPKGEGMGFGLAGLRVIEVHGAKEGLELLEQEMADERNGVILIDETFIETLSLRMRKKVDESTVPLIVGIPIITKWELIHDRKEIIEHIIRRAVGYRIKLGGD